MKSFLTASLLVLSAHVAHGQLVVSPDGQTLPPHGASYQSAFETYVPWGDVAIRSWREANEQVLERGGWLSYAKEAAAERRASEGSK